VPLVAASAAELLVLSSFAAKLHTNLHLNDRRGISLFGLAIIQDI